MKTYFNFNISISIKKLYSTRQFNVKKIGKPMISLNNLVFLSTLSSFPLFDIKWTSKINFLLFEFVWRLKFEKGFSIITHVNTHQCFTTLRSLSRNDKLWLFSQINVSDKHFPPLNDIFLGKHRNKKKVWD